MSDAAAWDARYAGGGFAFGEAPNRYLESLAPRLRPGMRALALGDGEGRNGTWLAERGLAVTSVDWSAAGLAKAAALAGRRGVALRTVVADLAAWDWPRGDAAAGDFDLVAWIFVHLPPADRALVAGRAAAALAPGGLLALEGFSPAQEGRRSGGPRDPALLWTGAEARRLFAGLELLECLEGTVRLDEGPRHQGEAEVVRGLWRRPG
ncbi:methyltransferase domain-containing protein [Roseomonas sp. OT10]|uniref:SAM-dependent methyltransferase n=1 Tax=Roseomonas cutis TaxID=2897332 RepID=UPI001E3EFF57|nr:class I SAM-dependent methyltransferase [Roseomonas sp. OT10]UFN48717.1 methyltransferase domain-containing protein [Roseomonas sp. OT10]